MKTSISVRAALAALVLAGAGSATADTLYSAGATGALATDTSVPASFAALAGPGSLSLQLQGYATLDGDNFWIDILHIALNGTEVFTGTWDLGGGGIDRVLFNPAGGSAVKDATAHTVDIVVPLALHSGSNTLAISVESPGSFEGSARAGFQGLGDEGWGLNQVTVTGVVPEPGSAVLMFGGLALVGWLARRRQR